MWHFWLTADLLSRILAAVLLSMSMATWVVILWKAWVLAQAGSSVRKAVIAFWQSSEFEAGCAQAAHWDKDVGLLLKASVLPVSGTLAVAGSVRARLTRALREALAASSRRLQWGQTLLASVGATAPFVGLLGTVWGIYHAMTGLGQAADLTLDQVAGPVGEALVMTAMGLAVALPAVLAYNFLGRRASAIEAELEGFAHDVLELLACREA
ncbi:MAG: Biopolymer transport protein ExbB [Pseudomonadota bacterium]|jgi:biopolymer transport protein ExbB